LGRYTRRRPQAHLNIAQTLPIGELGEGHAQELVPTPETTQPGITVVAGDATAKLSIRKVGNQLRKHSAANVHAPLLAASTLVGIQIAAS